MPPYRSVLCTSATMLPTYRKLFGLLSGVCLHLAIYLQYHGDNEQYHRVLAV